MDLPQLKYFVSIARLGGFNAAARARHVSQSALSRQVALLEAEIGAALFERTRRGVTLTPAGVALRDRAERILSQVSRLKAEVLTEVDQPTGRVGLGLSQSIARVFGAEIISRYQVSYPNVRLHVLEDISDILVAKVISGEIDVAVATDDALTRDVTSRRLMKDRVALIGAPSLFVELPSSVDIEHTLSLPLILPRHPSGSRALLERSLGVTGKSISPLIEVETLSLMIELAVAGHGFLVLPFCAVRPEIAAGTLAARPLGGLACQWMAAWSAQRPHTAAPRKLVQLISEITTAANAGLASSKR